jgi:hypothetical protein
MSKKKIENQRKRARTNLRGATQTTNHLYTQVRPGGVKKNPVDQPPGHNILSPLGKPNNN